MTNTIRYLPALPERDRRALLELYCRVCERDIDSLARALADGKHSYVKAIAHRIKGSSSAIGASAVAQFAEWLENCSETDVQSPQTLQRLQAAFQRVVDDVNNAGGES